MLEANHTPGVVNGEEEGREGCLVTVHNMKKSERKKVGRGELKSYRKLHA